MKRLAILITALLLCAAKPNPAFYPRTLAVNVPGQDKALLLAAPKGTCFLDATSPAQAGIIKKYQEIAKKNKSQVLLGVFTDCDNITAMIQQSEDGPVPTLIGAVSWISGLDTAQMTRDSYLPLWQESEKTYIDKSPQDFDGLLQAGAARREQNSVTFTLAGYTGSEDEKIFNFKVVTSTLVRGLPLETTLTMTGADNLPIEKLYPLVDKFTAQTIALNEQ